MFCLKCGEAILDGSSFCPFCGINLIEESKKQSIVYASQKDLDTTNDQPKANKKMPNRLMFSVIAIVGVIAVFFILNSINQANLKKALVKEWYDYENSIIKVLDIDDDKMEYRIETGYRSLDTTLGIYDWKPVGRNKIKIKMVGDRFETYTIEFYDNKSMMQISPAITSTDSSEIWFLLD